MLGESEIKKILDKTLGLSSADQTEVLLWTTERALTRFANNAIHQNMIEANTAIIVRVVSSQKIGIASINSLEAAALEKVVENASTITRHQREDPDFRSLPSPAPIRQISAYKEHTAQFTPEERSEMVGIISRKSASKGLVASGALQTTVSEIGVANSLGVFGYHPATQADINTVIMSDSGSGYADAFSWNVDDLQVEKIADEAIDKALRSRNPIDLDPGEYDVILEEYAVSDIMDFLAYLSFGARAVQEKQSFMAGKFGQRVMDERISIWDDGLDPSGIPMPFDFEGVPKERVEFIVNGVANAVCYDSNTANREGKKSTGHALPPPNTFGPFPSNMFMQSGAHTKEEMLASTKRGLWITRFHYTRHLHPLKVIVTGMTRDGTFLIENGEISRPIKNLRFTQSYPGALNNIQMVGKTTKLEGGFFGNNRVPALKIGNWTFVSATTY